MEKKEKREKSKTTKTIKTTKNSTIQVKNSKISTIWKSFSDLSPKLKKKDWIIIGVLILIFLVVAIYNLGTFNNPKTYHQFTDIGEDVGIELKTIAQDVSKIRYYTGPEIGTFKVMVSTDGEVFKEAAILEEKSVFAWEDLDIDSSFKYIKFVSTTVGGYIGEVQLFNKYGDKLTAVSSDDQSAAIVDEASTVPAKITNVNSSYFDEVYFARSAYEYAHGIETTEWVHPPLGKLIIMIPILLFGMSTFSFRIMGVLAGAAMIPVIYTLAKRIFKSRKWALLAGVLMTFDCFHFAQSRMGTVDTFLVLFIMLSALFMYQYIDLDKKASLKTKRNNLLLSGLFIGLAIATKWTGLYAGLALAITFITSLIYRSKVKKEKEKDYKKIILYVVLFFLVIPVVIYLLSYLLFPNVFNYNGNIINQIKEMFNYHSQLNENHDFSSKWYTWPAMVKPVWYYVGYYGGNIKSTIVGIGNPAIWWFGILASIFVLIASWLKKKKEYLFILVFIICTWLPYMFIGREMFMYHYYPTLPFVMLAIVAFIKWITSKIKNNSFYIFYVAVVILMFLLFYPVISGMVTNGNYIDSLRWLSSWMF